MQRIVIVGSGGSGKSTLAKQMGLVLGLNVVHLDRLLWKPGYVIWFRRSNFIHVMTMDLLVLTLLFPTLLREDMARRGVSEESWVGRIALAVPLLGPAWYLVRRPAEQTEPLIPPGGRKSARRL